MTGTTAAKSTRFHDPPSMRHASFGAGVAWADTSNREAISVGLPMSGVRKYVGVDRLSASRGNVPVARAVDDIGFVRCDDGGSDPCRIRCVAVEVVGATQDSRRGLGCCAVDTARLKVVQRDQAHAEFPNAAVGTVNDDPV